MPPNLFSCLWVVSNPSRLVRRCIYRRHGLCFGRDDIHVDKSLVFSPTLKKQISCGLGVCVQCFICALVLHVWRSLLLVISEATMTIAGCPSQPMSQEVKLDVGIACEWRSFICQSTRVEIIRTCDQQNPHFIMRCLQVWPFIGRYFSIRFEC